MHLTPILAFYSTSLLASIAFATPVSTTEPIQNWSLNQLEQRLTYIDAELDKLAQFSLRGGMGSIGYRSFRHSRPEQREWIQIDFERSAVIDQIVLVPAIWHDATSGYRADGFPLRFQILAGTNENKLGSVIASFDETNNLLPRIAPVIVPCEVNASWVRIETSLLSPAAFDGKYNLELSEIMVFSGEENIALRQAIQTSSISNPTAAREEKYVVDGYVPYVMNSNRGGRSAAFIGVSEPNASQSLSLDLGKTYPLNRIHLHSVDLSETIPLSRPADFGIPRNMILEGANLPDFSDAVPLVDYRINSVFESGPVIMRNFPETACRYIRLLTGQPSLESVGEHLISYIGFAELELFSKGRNIARGKAIESTLDLDNLKRSPLALTDGLNTYGQILPVREWLNELAQRHTLETQRPLITTELSIRYAQQKNQLKWVSAIAAILAVGIVITFLIDRLLRIRIILEIKKRFAADLHDELGANIHTIEILNEISRDADSQEERDLLSDRISNMTQLTATSIRYFSSMHEEKNLHIGLADEMRRAAERIATNIEYDIAVKGAESLRRLKPLVRADLLLFYKESLVNIIRHSNATQFCVNLEAGVKEVRLTISDNGVGMPESHVHTSPASLKRRAKLIGANITCERPSSGGTIITLVIRPNRLNFLRKRITVIP